MMLRWQGRQGVMGHGMSRHGLLRQARRNAVCAVVMAAQTLLVGEVLAQGTTIRDGSGRTVGTASTDSSGTTTFRDSSGRTTGRSSTNSGGDTVIYDAKGNRVGTVTTLPRR